MRRKHILASIVALLIGGAAMAQIPVEVFGGHARTTLDVMFFKFFRNREGNATKWLFFNRDRASIDYRMTRSSFLPQFGLTEAISYNHPKLHGLAPVAVVQASGAGVFPKAGVQYAYVTERLTVFTWVVCETWARPTLDAFALLRWTPHLSEKWQLFLQCEAFAGFATDAGRSHMLVQRARIGLGTKVWRWGIGADLTELGRAPLLLTTNAGLFLRHEF